MLSCGGREIGKRINTSTTYLKLLTNSGNLGTAKVFDQGPRRHFEIGVTSTYKKS